MVSMSAFRALSSGTLHLRVTGDTFFEGVQISLPKIYQSIDMIEKDQSGIRKVQPRKVQLRGEETKKRLLEVATRLFSERGFDGVSTRDIASEAETTLPSIPHHFESKEGIYRAVLAGIAEEMMTRLAAASARAMDVLNKKDASRQEKLEALGHLLSTHARSVLHSRPEWARLMVHEQLHPSAALTPITRVLEQYLVGPLVRLIADLRGLSAKSVEVRLEALTLVGRILIFRTARHSSLHIMGWEEYTPSRIERIVETLNSHLNRLFSGDDS
jgi:TetR/AcrR family transcriptional regulator, regulator of cefoperazone and chloramphenicol sensitivity